MRQKIKAFLLKLVAPRGKRLALQKRRLDALLQREGLSRSAARRVTSEFFK